MSQHKSFVTKGNRTSLLILSQNPVNNNIDSEAHAYPLQGIRITIFLMSKRKKTIDRQMLIKWKTAANCKRHF